MDLLHEIGARIQIHELADRYAIACDAKDLDQMANLFVEDVSNGRYGLGREGVRAYFDNILREFHCSMHMVGNHVIDFDDDDHAHGVVYCRAHHHVLSPEHWFDEALAYWDTYERHGDQWYFRRRIPKSWYRQEFGHPTRGTERAVALQDVQRQLRGAQMPEAFPTFAHFWEREPKPIPSD